MVGRGYLQKKRERNIVIIPTLHAKQPTGSYFYRQRMYASAAEIHRASGLHSESSLDLHVDRNRAQ